MKEKAVLSCGSPCRSQDQPGGNPQAHSMIQYLLKELEEQYVTAKADMMLAAKSKPIHGENQHVEHH